MFRYASRITLCVCKTKPQKWPESKSWARECGKYSFKLMKIHRPSRLPWPSYPQQHHDSSRKSTFPVFSVPTIYQLEEQEDEEKLFIEKNSSAVVLKIQKLRVEETRICKFSSLRSKSPCVRVRLMFTLAGKCITWRCCLDQVSKQKFMASNCEI